MPTTRRRLKQLAEEQPEKVPSSSVSNTTKRGAIADNYNDNDSDNDEDVDDDNNHGGSTNNNNNIDNRVFLFNGIEYKSYQEMVNAKRKRNEEVMKGLGLMKDDDGGSMANLLTRAKKKPTASQRGIKKQKTEKQPVLQSRKSSRLSGGKTSLVALDYNVNNWNRDNSTTIVKLEEGDDDGDDGEDNGDTEKKPSFFRDRLNDGSDLTLEDAINLNESKWIHDNSLELAQTFQKGLIKDSSSSSSESTNNTTTKSPTSVAVVVKDDRSKDIAPLVNELSIDKQEWVAKVTPDRIYSVTAHPSETKLIACAGDKRGYVGLWDVDGAQHDDDDDKNNNNNNNGVHLFHVHSRPICAMEWLTPDAMVSASYDGTIRRLNVEAGTFEEIFATYDDSDTYYAEELGFGLDQGYRFWLQYVSVDHRFQGSSNPCLFAATSLGDVIHLDLRAANKQRITFNESLSEKKINSLSLHPNGHTLASAGLDGTVKLWDIRKFGSGKRKKSLEAIASQSTGYSVSSSFFSPSGDSLLTTSFADRLDLIQDAHLKEGVVKPTHSIRHNNQTGRWLSTFMATWHPELDIFVSGSMAKPRCMEVFDSSGKQMRAVTGESLTAVASRCCFHRSSNQLVMIGGNSSGRVVAVR